MSKDQDITLDYDIMEQIGKGGYGKVYRAVHKVTGIERAVKKINKRRLD